MLPGAGCSLTDVTIAEPDDLLVAEVQVVLTLAADNRNVSLTAWALLHRTYLFGEAPSLAGAVVKVSADSRRVVRLEEQDSLSSCVGENPFLRDDEESEPSPGAVCYRAEAARSPFVPGERLSLEIATPDGRLLTGSSRIPGAFFFTGLNHERGRCRMEPDTNYRFRWTAAKDAWAYVADARFEGPCQGVRCAQRRIARHPVPGGAQHPRRPVHRLPRELRALRLPLRGTRWNAR